jgi:hypothetical protein
VQQIPTARHRDGDAATTAGAGGHVGGCACGRLRFRSLAAPLDTGYCHCRTCQRTTGAPLLAYVSFPLAAFAYTAGTPSLYASSTFGRREFCSACGTQIAFRRDDGAGTVDVNAGAMDEPAAYPPRRHIWCESAIPWLVLGDALPRFAQAAEAAPPG